MRTIGLIGGVSWTSTVEYYRRLNKAISTKFGGFSSAKILLNSFNFAEILHYQSSNNSDAEARLLIEAARNLEKAGAEVILICSNTTNKTSFLVQKALCVPLINIIEATAERVSHDHIKNVGLLGTKYVMYGEFYANIFKKYGIHINVLNSDKCLLIHNIIYNELVKDIYLDVSKKYLLSAIKDLYHSGSQAVILGCTELPLIISQNDTFIPIFDTIQIHVDKAIEFVLTSEEIS